MLMIQLYILVSRVVDSRLEGADRRVRRECRAVQLHPARIDGTSVVSHR